MGVAIHGIADVVEAAAGKPASERQTVREVQHPVRLAKPGDSPRSRITASQNQAGSAAARSRSASTVSSPNRRMKRRRRLRRSCVAPGRHAGPLPPGGSMH